MARVVTFKAKATSYLLYALQDEASRFAILVSIAGRRLTISALVPALRQAHKACEPDGGSGFGSTSPFAPPFRGRVGPPLFQDGGAFSSSGPVFPCEYSGVGPGGALWGSPEEVT
eukprot:scaffold358_cov343-Pavlova_lutheri.AAC.11